MSEPTITINGVTLTSGEAMAVRVAVASMHAGLSQSAEMRAELGPIGPIYEAQLREVLCLMVVVA